jgi:hypothetical protein
MKTEENKEYFEYLNDLRESGVINMSGASPYLQEAYGLEREEAKKILLYWMENFESLQDL